MSAKRQVVVRIDGKKADSSFSKGKITNKTGNIHREEMAAAEETGESKIHTFAREYDSTLAVTKATSKRKNNIDMFKPIIIAILSALAIGSIMGVVMLKVIVNFDNDINGTPAILVPSDAEQKNNDTAANSENKGTLDAMSAFVLQGGVYSSVENAEAESAKFLENGYTPVIWEKDSQFFLLVHLGMTKEDLQDDTAVLMNNGIEVYAKEWQVVERKVDITKEEHEWLTQFQDNWNVSLGEGKIDKNKWESLLEQAPTESALLSSFISTLENQLDSLDNKEHNQILLAIWQAYDVALKG